MSLGDMWSPAAALKAVLVVILVFPILIHVVPSGTDKHLGGMQEYQQATPKTKAVKVATATSPCCVTPLPDTARGTDETWLERK